MRGFLRTLAVTGAATAALLGAGLTGTATAQAPAATRLTGGTTTVTTGPGVAGTLLRAGILPVATPPGRQSFSVGRRGLVTSFSFPVTGGAVDLTTLAGTIKHRGGIVFVNLRNGKRLSVSDFVIDTTTGTLTGRVNRTSTRVPVFTLDLSAATVSANGHQVKVGNIDVRLTAVAAGALNQTLGTSVFTGGLDIGTARTSLRV
jgi:Htaa